MQQLFTGTGNDIYKWYRSGSV